MGSSVSDRAGELRCSDSVTLSLEHLPPATLHRAHARDEDVATLGRASNGSSGDLMSIGTVVRTSARRTVPAMFLGLWLVSAPAAAQAPALSGRVASAAEGALEGVLVSAKRDGSNKTVTVVSHADGRYSFP